MSLNFNLKAIKDFENVCYTNGRLNQVTEVLIFGCMSVGFQDITKKNLPEFVARFRFVEKLHGPRLTKGGQPRPITCEEFASHVGLTTNSSRLTRQQFLKRQAEIAFNEELRDAEQDFGSKISPR